MQLTGVQPDPVLGIEKMLQQRLKAEARVADKESAAVKKAAREFEAMFVGMMLKSMRSTVGKDTLTGGGQGEEIYRSLLDQEFAAAAAKSGALGVAATIENHLVRQEKGEGKVGLEVIEVR